MKVKQQPACKYPLSRAPLEHPEITVIGTPRPRIPNVPMIHEVIRCHTRLFNLHAKDRKVPYPRWAKIVYQSHKLESKASPIAMTLT